MQEKQVTKAIFPVAGLGTRFLPATKASPKEMLPIVDKPLIQYVVEEAVKAGITELVFVTSSSKRAIEDHFDTNYELEQRLQQQGKTELLEMVQNIVPKGVDCIYVRQPQALGLGHAVLCARQVIGEHPFAVLLADDLIDASVSCLEQMMTCYHETHASVIAVQEIAKADSEKYGVIDVAKNWSGQGPINAIVEKPKPTEAPSQYGVVGRYLLTPEIFHHLAKLPPGRGGEIQLTDAIARLLNEQKVMALAFDGTRYDCGSKLGYMQAMITLGLKHPELGADFKHYLQNLIF
ncbi:UTP--glucose-1-phosphate uridylyltransferase GalU [Candidatus Berkiella aquae]|uniref:UTP--glucose-1-phosphate uridylyltransferase n=1 Tax=Candidatus Berkiella aquae TaxID=295108 RepID=A0A0Q9YP87_9GAMM|nr:UTP--glucose-1-phosphate uridylyltransferase GalU [Candidatus Berkiella aquae]MCS5712016.1 UTP--glucose-1-phosphate uridylyltransferase GalU [Candidatus Berkiella aquae]